MNYKVIWILWKRDLLHYWRNRIRAVVGLTMPMLWLFVFGSGLCRSFNSDIEYTQFIFPGIIAMSLIFNAIFSALDTVKDKEFGFLKEILVAPVPRWTIVIGRSLGAASTAAIQGVLILIFAPLVGVHLSLTTILLLLPTIWVVALSLSAIGILLASVTDNQEGFQFIVNFVNMPMFFLSGALFPLSQLPQWMEVLVRLNPASYAVDAMRKIVLGGYDSFTLFGYQVTLWFDILLLVIFSITLIAIAAKQFNRPR